MSAGVIFLMAEVMSILDLACGEIPRLPPTSKLNQ
jgi:hypothetical protein